MNAAALFATMTDTPEQEMENAVANMNEAETSYQRKSGLKLLLLFMRSFLSCMRFGTT